MRKAEYRNIVDISGDFDYIIIKTTNPVLYDNILNAVKGRVDQGNRLKRAG